MIRPPDRRVPNDGRCYGCGVAFGDLHVDGCQLEDCARCGQGCKRVLCVEYGCNNPLAPPRVLTPCPKCGEDDGQVCASFGCASPPAPPPRPTLIRHSGGPEAA